MPGRKSKSIRKSNKNKKRITRRKVRSVKRCKRCGRLIGGAVPQTGEEVTFTIKKAEGIMSTNEDVRVSPSPPNAYKESTKDSPKTGKIIESGNTQIKIKVHGCGDILTIPRANLSQIITFH